MAITPVAQSNVPAVGPYAAVKPEDNETTHSKPQPAATDIVQISSAAKTALQTAVQEATETALQTDKEASGGDLQAKRLQAREAAVEETKESPAASAQEAQGSSLSSKLGV
jgi:hypothetical protein